MALYTLKHKNRKIMDNVKSTLAHVSDFSVISLNSILSREEVMKLYGNHL